MTLQQVYVDLEGSYRDWLRAQPELSSLVQRRVWLGIPERAAEVESSYPCVNLFKIGIGQVSGQTLVDSARIQIDCWGKLKSKASVVPVMLAVKNLLESVTRGTMLRPGVKAAGCYQISDIWLPDPRTDRPRYVVEAICMATYSPGG